MSAFSGFVKSHRQLDEREVPTLCKKNKREFNDLEEYMEVENKLTKLYEDNDEFFRQFFYKVRDIVVNDDSSLDVAQDLAELAIDYAYYNITECSGSEADPVVIRETIENAVSRL